MNRRHNILIALALVLLCIASPVYADQNVIDPGVAYLQNVFTGGAIGQLFIWVVLLSICLLLWHASHGAGFLAIGLVVISAILWYRSPQLAAGFMTAVAGGNNIGAQ